MSLYFCGCSKGHRCPRLPVGKPTFSRRQKRASIDTFVAAAPPPHREPPRSRESPARRTARQCPPAEPARRREEWTRRTRRRRHRRRRHTRPDSARPARRPRRARRVPGRGPLIGRAGRPPCPEGRPRRQAPATTLRNGPAAVSILSGPWRRTRAKSAAAAPRPVCRASATVARSSWRHADRHHAGRPSRGALSVMLSHRVARLSRAARRPRPNEAWRPPLRGRLRCAAAPIGRWAPAAPGHVCMYVCTDAGRVPLILAQI
jgi:hypothetical protein